MSTLQLETYILILEMKKRGLDMFCLAWDQSQSIECGKKVSVTPGLYICSHNKVLPENNEPTEIAPHAQEQPYLFLIEKKNTIRL